MDAQQKYDIYALKTSLKQLGKLRGYSSHGYDGVDEQLIAERARDIQLVLKTYPEHVIQRWCASDNPEPLLTWAARETRPAAVLALLESGANVNVADREGGTALYYLSRLSSVETIRRLIDGGACIDAADNQGETPLHNAARGVRDEVIRYLVGQGANLEARDRDGLTPLLTAASIQLPSLYPDSAFWALVELGADIHAMTNYGWTPLHYAASAGWPGGGGRTRHLLDRGAGADVDVQDQDGNTPLHLAVSAGDCEYMTVSQLLEAGAAVDVRNDAGQRPIDLVNRTLIQNPQAKSREVALAADMLRAVDRRRRVNSILVDHPEKALSEAVSGPSV